jgi:lipocalin
MKTTNFDLNKTYNDEWFFIAENELRFETKNFDIDVNYQSEDENDIDTSEFVFACGGGEHYVIFKNEKSFNDNNSDFILNGKSYIYYIEIDKPIHLTESICFVLNFDND